MGYISQPGISRQFRGDQPAFVYTGKGEPMGGNPEGPKLNMTEDEFAIAQERTKIFGPKPNVQTKVGPSGEILSSAPTITKTVVPDEKAIKKHPKSKKTRVETKVTPGRVDQMLPGMENYGYAEPAKKATKYWRGTLGTESFTDPVSGQVVTVKLPKEKAFQGKWVEEPATPATPGSARPAPQGEFAGETGIEQLKYLKKKPGERLGKTVAKYDPKTAKAGRRSMPKKSKYKGTLLAGTDEAATRIRNTGTVAEVPQQLELPGIESPGYAGALGQQFRSVKPATRELQLKSQQGDWRAASSELPKGVAPKKSTRSFKGRS